MKKYQGAEALSFVVGLVFQTCYTVREVVCGIDIDNAARYYEHDYDTDAERLYWSCLNYLAGNTKVTVAELFSAEVDDEGRLINFYIHTDLEDCESRGHRYEFAWS